MFKRRAQYFLCDYKVWPFARLKPVQLHLCHVCTYSCLKASTCSMDVIPARAKLSLYWLILMDSSHSGTDLNTGPSQPLVLGRRMDTLQGTVYIRIIHHLLPRYVHRVHVKECFNQF